MTIEKMAEPFKIVDNHKRSVIVNTGDIIAALCAYDRELSKAFVGLTVNDPEVDMCGLIEGDRLQRSINFRNLCISFSVQCV